MNVNNRIIYFFLQQKKKYIIFPTHEELHTVAPHYPGAVGAIDGTHIFAKVEKAQQDSYIDRYRRHSINLMAICDGNCFFTYIFVGFPGSAHDSRVFQNSSLYHQIESHGPQKFFDENFHLIGDSAFGLRSWLMTPYKGNNLTRKQKKHNYMLSADRVKIEHAFGLLKGRWRRLQYINVYNICKTVEIITASCVLHNFCLINKDLWDEEAPIECADRILNYQEEEDQQEGRVKRDVIANSF
ncbi:putative nuclease HARBI1 [Coccinella septempunctata]|uniref:putative nuclease HARBI1 n=1 Tax=Coccinella septempunctata TaxID=41139 RepID=UPI001D08E8BD|nr:putative nuclease HARBI1 [Coccinella septempunctata]